MSMGMLVSCNSLYRLLDNLSISRRELQYFLLLLTSYLPQKNLTGTVRTCTAQGFFEQFGVSTVMCEFDIFFFLFSTICDIY